MKRSRILRLAGLLVFVVSLAACAVRQQTATSVVSDADLIAALADRVWVAEYIHGRPVVDMSHTSMVFTTDDNVNGSGGCNAYSGSYTLKNGKISFGPLASTMRMCAEALSDQEMRFHQSLSAPQKVSFENGLLKLTPAEGEPSIFAVQEME